MKTGSSLRTANLFFVPLMMRFFLCLTAAIMTGFLVWQSNGIVFAATTTNFNIMASRTGTGTISPSGTIKVSLNQNKAFTMRPGANYRIGDVLVDGVSVGPVTSYTFSNVSANHTISVSFVPNTYKIVATAGSNGSITPSGSATVKPGASQTYTIIPNANCRISDVLVDGVSVGAVTRYTFSKVAANHAISASFAPIAYNINATPGINGSITPTGATTINQGASQTYSITPNAGYRISDVLVDGVSVGAVTSYIFSKVAANHAITASFVPNTYSISASAGSNGSMSPSGSTTVNDGASQTYSIVPDANYQVADVLVDGVSVGAVTSYTFSDVNADHILVASFTPAYAKVTVAWDSNSEPDVVGYRLHYGESSRNYSQSLDVGKKTTSEVGGLVPGRTYYLAATAYTSSGLQSGYSTEISFTIAINGAVVQLPAGSVQSASAQSSQMLGSQSTSGGPGTQMTQQSSSALGTGTRDSETGRDGPKPKENEAGPPQALAVVAGSGFSPNAGGWMELIDPNTHLSSTLRVNWPEYNAMNGEMRVVGCDIDGDGKQELIVGLGPVEGHPGVPGGYFLVLEHDHSLLTWGRIQWSDYNTQNGESWPACADLEGNGRANVIIGLGLGGKGRFEVFAYEDGKLQHKAWGRLNWKDYNTVIGEVRPAGGDIDQDGKDEVILGLAAQASKSFAPKGVFAVLDDDLTHQAWGQIEWPAYNQVNGSTRPASGDVNGDGKAEILVGLGAGGAGRTAIFEYDTLSKKVVPQQWIDINWDQYSRAFGETRPTLGLPGADLESTIAIGLGKGGGGYLFLFYGATSGFAPRDTLKMSFADYSRSFGESWPAVLSGSSSH